MISRGLSQLRPHPIPARSGHAIRQPVGSTRRDRPARGGLDPIEKAVTHYRVLANADPEPCGRV
jgi:hypothetical protein